MSGRGMTMLDGVCMQPLRCGVGHHFNTFLAIPGLFRRGHS